MLISDCSSDLCSSDLFRQLEVLLGRAHFVREKGRVRLSETGQRLLPAITGAFAAMGDAFGALGSDEAEVLTINTVTSFGGSWLSARIGSRSEEHTSELQSLMRISYAVFCLKKKKISHTQEEDKLKK